MKGQLMKKQKFGGIDRFCCTLNELVELQYFSTQTVKGKYFTAIVSRLHCSNILQGQNTSSEGCCTSS